MTWDEIKEHLEPIGSRAYIHNPELDVQISIAISLKRIADKLELASKQPIVMDANEYAKYKAINK